MTVMDVQRFLYLAQCSLRVCFVTLTNLYCIPTYLLWMWGLLLPFRLLNHPLYWQVEGVMYRWLLSVVATWSWNSGYCIVELGDDVSSLTHDRCLFIVNHQSTADVPFLMLAFQEKPGVLDSVMWIMDRMFRYTNFGAVSVTHGDYFITQGKNARDYQMKKLRDHLINVFLGRNRRWIILFPEGGFLSKRLETSTKYAAKNNFPLLEHVTLPRIGAMEMVLQTLRPDGNFTNVLDEEVSLLLGSPEEREPLKWVIDVTVAYPEVSRPIDLLAICASTRPPCNTYMHYRRYPVEKVPIHSTDALRDWTYARWAEKEELLKEYYETGTFPLVPRSQRTTSKGGTGSKGVDSRASGDCVASEDGEVIRSSDSEVTRSRGCEDIRSNKDCEDIRNKGCEEVSSKDCEDVRSIDSEVKRSRDGEDVNSRDCEDIRSKDSEVTISSNDNIGKLSGDHLNMTDSNNRIGKASENIASEDTATSNDISNNVSPVKVSHQSHKVLMSMGKIVFLHAFFVSSTLFHYYLLSRAWNYARN